MENVGTVKSDDGRKYVDSEASNLEVKSLAEANTVESLAFSFKSNSELTEEFKANCVETDSKSLTFILSEIVDCDANTLELDLSRKFPDTESKSLTFILSESVDDEANIPELDFMKKLEESDESSFTGNPALSD